MRFPMAPESCPAALRTHAAVSASMMSATASAAHSSMRPFKKARFVNSPGPACLAPSAKSSSSSMRSTAGEPWH